MQLQKITDAYSHATIILLNIRISKSFFCSGFHLYIKYIYIFVFLVLGFLIFNNYSNFSSNIARTKFRSNTFLTNTIRVSYAIAEMADSAIHLSY